MSKKAFSFKRLYKSFGYAFQGLMFMLRNEQNATIHLLITIGVVAAGIYFRITTNEWVAVITMIGFVFSAEAINTSIEELSDLVSSEYNERIKKVKDLSSGAVLFAAMAASLVGLLIFLPKIIQLF